MLSSWMNWKNLLALGAVLIVISTIFYSRILSGKIAAEERQKVESWAEAVRFIARAGSDQDIMFATIITAGQNTIPVIETNERDSVMNFHNLDSAEVANDTGYLRRKLKEFARSNDAIVTYLDPGRSRFNRYYYGESALLKQVRYFPLIQLLIVALFITLMLLAMSARHRSAQNQLWAGMARETAHQLGTPLTALEGWVEMLKENPQDSMMLQEMEKDIGRLKLVSERFSKIGSQPKLEQHDLVRIIPQVMEYVRKRAPGSVQFSFDDGGIPALPVMISAPLFEWVVENLLKNALDAMDGKGNIRIRLSQSEKTITLDITDTGKGIHPALLGKVFQPGFTTKKRGWGLGLTLARRIVEQYHGGELFVRSSEPGKGTTFRILLRKKAT